MHPEDRKILASLSLEADTSEFRRASSWIDEVGRLNGMPGEEIHRLDLCLNEALANVVEHGGEGALESGIELRFEIAGQSGIQTAAITVIDGGRPFNPVTHVTRTAPTSLEEASQGGLGIQMIRTYADELDYGFLGNQNHLRFAVRWPQAALTP